jgi:hypothetical protein
VDTTADAVATLELAGRHVGDRDDVSGSIRRSPARTWVRTRLVELGQHRLQVTPTEDLQLV